LPVFPRKHQRRARGVLAVPDGHPAVGSVRAFHALASTGRVGAREPVEVVHLYPSLRVSLTVEIMPFVLVGLSAAGGKWSNMDAHVLMPASDSRKCSPVSVST